MNEYIIVAIISGLVTIFATAITAWGAVRKSQHAFELAMQECKHQIAALKKSQDKHNGLIEKMTAAEKDIVALKQSGSSAHKRIDGIERRMG
jgi:uncharacterized membrane protein (DUF106 family)